MRRAPAQVVSRAMFRLGTIYRSGTWDRPWAGHRSSRTGNAGFGDAICSYEFVSNAGELRETSKAGSANLPILSDPFLLL